MSGRFSYRIKILLCAVLIVLTCLFSASAAGQISCFIDSITLNDFEEQTSSKAVSEKEESSVVISVNSDPEKSDEADYETPEDILEYEIEYIEAHKGINAFGKVAERFFVDDAATDKIGNVAVRNCTEKNPDFETLLSEGLNSTFENTGDPLVLIFHTHTTESYLPVYDGGFYSDFKTRSIDPQKSVVRVGDAICGSLEKHGIVTLHDTSVYDNVYDGAYQRSRKTVLNYLEKYPSIKIVLDIHRDAVYPTNTSSVKPTAVIGGRKAAQVMIITGAQDGGITDFPDWEKNLSFSLALQNAVQNKYEGLMKPIFFCARKYNMDVCPNSLLLEFGTDTNTLDEAVYSGYLFGNALAEFIKGCTNEE